MPRYALLVAYDGSDFCGWWRQPDQLSVAAHFDQAFARLGEATAAVLGAARTDAGVHAEGQVCHVDCKRVWQADELVHALNGQLGAAVSCLAAAAVADEWHACHAASGKTYRYELDVSRSPNPLRARFSWRPPKRPVLADLAALASVMPGERDWVAFARSSDYREDYVRLLQEVQWSAAQTQPQQQCYSCHVRGTGFTYHLVRSLVGAMIATATGQCTQRDFEQALAGTRSPAADFQAPAKGLCLESVHYDVAIDWIFQR